MEPPAFPRLSPMSEEEVERALEVGLAPAPITDARRKAETPVRPCWEGAGPEQVQSQPLDPLCQHLSGGAPRSLPVLAPSHSHTQEVLWAYLLAKAQQATLTRPCSEDLGEPRPIAPSLVQATWPLQPPLSYYHNFLERHCRASASREASVFYRMFCVLLPLSHS